MLFKSSGEKWLKAPFVFTSLFGCAFLSALISLFKYFDLILLNFVLYLELGELAL